MPKFDTLSDIVRWVDRHETDDYPLGRNVRGKAIWEVVSQRGGNQTIQRITVPPGGRPSKPKKTTGGKRAKIGIGQDGRPRLFFLMEPNNAIRIETGAFQQMGYSRPATDSKYGDFYFGITHGKTKSEAYSEPTRPGVLKALGKHSGSSRAEILNLFDDKHRDAVSRILDEVIRDGKAVENASGLFRSDLIPKNESESKADQGSVQNTFGPQDRMVPLPKTTIRSLDKQENRLALLEVLRKFPTEKGVSARPDAQFFMWNKSYGFLRLKTGDDKFGEDFDLSPGTQRAVSKEGRRLLDVAQTGDVVYGIRSFKDDYEIHIAINNGDSLSMAYLGKIDTLPVGGRTLITNLPMRDEEPDPKADSKAADKPQDTEIVELLRKYKAKVFVDFTPEDFKGVWYDEEIPDLIAHLAADDLLDKYYDRVLDHVTRKLDDQAKREVRVSFEKERTRHGLLKKGTYQEGHHSPAEKVVLQEMADYPSRRGEWLDLVDGVVDRRVKLDGVQHTFDYDQLSIALNHLIDRGCAKREYVDTIAYVSLTGQGTREALKMGFHVELDEDETAELRDEALQALRSHPRYAKLRDELVQVRQDLSETDYSAEEFRLRDVEKSILRDLHDILKEAYPGIGSIIPDWEELDEYDLLDPGMDPKQVPNPDQIELILPNEPLVFEKGRKSQPTKTPKAQPGKLWDTLNKHVDSLPDPKDFPTDAEILSAWAEHGHRFKTDSRPSKDPATKAKELYEEFKDKHSLFDTDKKYKNDFLRRLKSISEELPPDSSALTYVDAIRTRMSKDLLDTTSYEPEEDVTDRIVSQYTNRLRRLRLGAIKPMTKITDAGRRVLEKFDDLTLGYVSNPLMFDESVKRLPKRDHKTLIRLILGGHMRIMRIPGDLPGNHKDSRIGAKAGYHYRLKAQASL